MKIKELIVNANLLLVVQGGFGPNGALGRSYLQGASEAIKKGYGLDDDLDQDTIENGRYEALPVKAEKKPRGTAPDPRAVQPESNEGNPPGGGEGKNDLDKDLTPQVPRIPLDGEPPKEGSNAGPLGSSSFPTP